MTIQMKKKYITPLVLKGVMLELETDLLLGSVVEKRVEVETAGHEVVDHDISSSDFNHDWK